MQPSQLASRWQGSDRWCNSYPSLPIKWKQPGTTVTLLLLITMCDSRRPGHAGASWCWISWRTKRRNPFPVLRLFPCSYVSVALPYCAMPELSAYLLFSVLLISFEDGYVNRAEGGLVPPGPTPPLEDNASPAVTDGTVSRQTLQPQEHQVHTSPLVPSG